MIAQLKGILDQRGMNDIVVDVNGVGYEVFVSNRTMNAIGTIGDPVTIRIHTEVREDRIQLFGFADAVERKWFTQLTKVRGVGAKVGLAILSSISPDELSAALVSGDKSKLSQADGVGPKLAARLVTELKDAAGDISLSVAADDAAGKPDQTKAGPAGGGNQKVDAVSALTNLGYGRSEAFGAVSQVLSGTDGQDIPLPTLIRLSLKELTG